MKFVLVHDEARRNAIAAVAAAPAGYAVVIKKPTRTLAQNDKFHALCGDLAGTEWAGRPRDREQWKVLLISGHATATKEGADMVPGLEGEFVNLRESSATMTKARGSSLIEYAQAFVAQSVN